MSSVGRAPRWRPGRGPPNEVKMRRCERDVLWREIAKLEDERDGFEAAPRRLAEALAGLLAALSEAPGSGDSIGWAIRLSERRDEVRASWSD